MLFWFCILTTLASRSWAMDGNALWDICQKTDPSNKMYCETYITGAVEAIIMLRKYTGNLSCPPAETIILQIADVTRNYLRDNPATRNYTAASLVVAAMAQAWPCPKQ
jgi:hypothetical protein